MPLTVVPDKGVFVSLPLLVGVSALHDSQAECQPNFHCDSTSTEGQLLLPSDSARVVLGLCMSQMGSTAVRVLTSGDKLLGAGSGHCAALLLS